MGYDAYAQVVVGLPSEEVFSTKVVNGTVRRYNEETGAPYDKPTVTQTCLLFGKEFDGGDDEDTLFQFLDKNLKTFDVDLEFFPPTCESCTCLIGYKVAEIGGRGNKTPYELIPPVMVEHLLSKFKSITGVSGRLYLTMYHSY